MVMSRFLLLILLGLVTTSPLTAAERYITGIPIPLRAEPDPANRKILQLLPIGEAVIVEKEVQEGFARVTTHSGISGWIPTRYLSDTSPLVKGGSGDTQKLVQCELEVTSQKNTIRSLQQERSLLETDMERLKTSMQRANKEASSIRDVSSEALGLQQQNETLQTQVQRQIREIEMLQQEITTLRQRKERDWFIVGALVALTMLVVGFLLARSRRGNNHDRRGTLYR